MANDQATPDRDDRPSKGLSDALRLELDLLETLASTTEKDSPAPSGRLILLVADDDPEIRGYISRCVLALSESIGTVVEAANGSQALEHLRHHGADILVSDVVMPVLDGFELCRIIRRDPILRDLPILLITGEGDRRHMERESARAGANSVLAKPFNARRLCDRIELLLRSRSPPPTDEASEDDRTDPDPHDGKNSTQEES